MSSIGSVGSSSASDLLAQIRQQLLARMASNNVSTTTDSTSAASDDTTSDTGSTPAASGSGTPQFGPGSLTVLILMQEQASDSGSDPATAGAIGGASPGQSLFASLDVDGDGQISKSDLEAAIGADGGTTRQADNVFGKLDSNGDGSVSRGELASAMHKGRHHHHVAAPGDDGNDPLASLLQGDSSSVGQGTTVTNPDGSTTTTITYADGTKVTLSTPATADANGSDDSGSDGTTAANAAGSQTQPNSERLLAALIRLQEQSFQSAATSTVPSSQAA